MSTGNAAWLIAIVVLAGSTLWTLRIWRQDRREAARAREEFEKTKLAAEMREARTKR